MKPIPRCPGYFADEHGFVWSFKGHGQGGRGEPQWRRLWRGCKTNGYPVVLVVEDGRKRPRRVHQLVARAFYGERPEGQQVRHLDGTRDNNRPENLAYGTQRQNHDDCKRHGRTGRWGTHHKAKLTPQDIPWIRVYGAMGFSNRTIAKPFGVTFGAIGAILRGENWSYVP